MKFITLWKGLDVGFLKLKFNSVKDIVSLKCFQEMKIGFLESGVERNAVVLQYFTQLGR